MLSEYLLQQIANNNPHLIHLNLRSKNISLEDCEELVKAFKTNTTITNLDLSWNYLFPEAMTILAEIFKTNTTLKSVNLNNNNLKAEGIFILAEALDGNKTLKTLDIGNNATYLPRGSEQEPISTLLEKATALTTLDVWNGCLGGSISSIAGVLETNTTLTNLNIGYADYSKEEFIAVANMLEKNKTLTDLNFQNINEKKLTVDKVQVISEAMNKNTSLCHLKLISSDYETESIKEPIKALNLKLKKNKPNDILPNVSQVPAGMFAHSGKVIEKPKKIADPTSLLMRKRAASCPILRR